MGWFGAPQPEPLHSHLGFTAEPQLKRLNKAEEGGEAEERGEQPMPGQQASAFLGTSAFLRFREALFPLGDELQNPG